MLQTISKSQFKPKVLEYLRKVEKEKKPLVITHAGKPTVQIIPYKEDEGELLKDLKGSVISYKQPTKPVDESDWEVLK